MPPKGFLTQCSCFGCPATERRQAHGAWRCDRCEAKACSHGAPQVGYLVTCSCYGCGRVDRSTEPSWKCLACAAGRCAHLPILGPCG